MYEVCLSYIIYCLLFYIITILTPPPPLPCHFFGIYYTKGKDFRDYCTQGLYPEEDKDSDEWWRARLLNDGFNEACKNIATSYLKVGDESMSKIRFRTTEKGNLPHLSYTFRNP